MSKRKLDKSKKHKIRGGQQSQTSIEINEAAWQAQNEARDRAIAERDSQAATGSLTKVKE